MSLSPENKALVERAIGLCWEEGFDAEGRAVQALLDATRAQGQTEEGWRLVPVEPTEAMYQAGRKQAADCTADFTCQSACISEHIWDAMLAAAPTPESRHG